MAVLLKVTVLFLMRDDSDEYAPRVLKFIGSFIASFGEEISENEQSHPLIACMFKEILSVSSEALNLRVQPANLFLIAAHIQVLAYSSQNLLARNSHHDFIFSKSRNRRGNHGRSH